MYTKNAVKWISNEVFVSYSDNEKHFKKCNEVNILPQPVSKVFALLNDQVFFHKIVNCQTTTKLPYFITVVHLNSILRSKNLDNY